MPWLLAGRQRPRERTASPAIVLAAIGRLCIGCVLPDYDKVDQPHALPESPPESATHAACCAASHDAGCVDGDVQACVCATDTFCCDEAWDASCVAEVQEFDCGSCPDDATVEAPPLTCGSSSDCGAGTSICDRGVCVQCRSDADCSGVLADFPYCGADSSCVECKADADCEALYGADFPYCAGGTCASP